MFQGDIAQFTPADLLLFLSHMNKEGILTVQQDDDALSLSFRRNLIVDASCEPAERLILEMLERRGAATPDTLARLRQAREETGLPLTLILADVEWLSESDVGDTMTAGLRETVFRLMLWDRGAFQFTEIAVDDNPHLKPMDGQALVMDLTREVDEYRELLRGIGSLERRGQTATTPDEASAEEEYVLAHAGAAESMHELLIEAPFPRLTTAWALATAIDRGWLSLTTAPAESETGQDDAPDAAGVFPAYRQSLRRLLQAPNQQTSIRELLQFAQSQCLQSILLVVSGDRLKRATVYRRDHHGRLTASDYRAPKVDLASDMVFQQALSAGRLFVGSVFPSPVIEALGAELPASDCALLPLGRLGGYDLLLYAVTEEPSGLTAPLACLELLSWQIRPPQDDQPAAEEAQDTTQESRRDEARLDSDDDAAARLVASIKDLPPMSHVVAKILELLADTDCDMNEVTEALSHDPALVARLIKVSNSSLYGGYQATGSLNQAVVRLGTRTTRSVVVAASTRSLFPMDNTRTGLLGRALWLHAVQTGLAARRVAEFTRRVDADEAFAAGVLHDIGKVIILLNQPEEYAEAHRRLEAGASDSVYVERELLGFDHCLVGDRLLDSWGMPANLRAAARWHHEPAGAGELTSLAQVVACGDLLSHSLGDGNGAGGRLEERLDEAYEALGLDGGARSDLAELMAVDVEQSDLLD